MPVDGLKTKYPWTDANRFKLVAVVHAVKVEGKTHSLKWREVARRLQNDSDLDESMFSRLCAKQFDNLYRAYTKFKQDGDQPPRLTTEVIAKFDELFPETVAVKKAPKVNGVRGSLDTKSRAPGVMRGKPRGKKGHQLTWSNITRINLLTAIRVSTTKEGKIHWDEVVACMPNDFGISEERLCSLCMKQFTDLSSRYKDYKMAGVRPRRLTIEIIQNMDELYQNFPNLNPLPIGGQDVFENDREGVSLERTVSTPAASEDETEHRSSSRLTVPSPSSPDSEPSPGPAPARSPTIPTSAPARSPTIPTSAPAPTAPRASDPPPSRTSVPTSAPTPVRGPAPASAPTPPSPSPSPSPSPQDPAPAPAPAADSNREGDEIPPARRDMGNSGKRKASHDQGEMSSHEDYKDDQEVGFDRVERELLQLKSWLRQEVLPVGKEVLARVQAYGRRNHTGKSSKCDPHDDFDKLIYEASQKSTVLFIRAQFQQARANILKEVKDTIERVGMDLLHRRSSPFESTPAGLPGHSKEDPLKSG